MVKLNKIIIVLTALVLTSCAASKPPLILQVDKTQALTPLEQADLKSALGHTVRWGGTILEIINKKDFSQIIILGYPLDNQARPIYYGRNGTRRFIANFSNFIEPNTYTKNREITIIGKLEGIEQSKIGEFDYEFPVITVEKHLLWPTRSYYDYDPYYNDNYYYWYSDSLYYYPHYRGHRRINHHGHHYSH